MMVTFLILYQDMCRIPRNSAQREPPAANSPIPQVEKPQWMPAFSDSFLQALFTTEDEATFDVVMDSLLDVA